MRRRGGTGTRVTRTPTRSLTSDCRRLPRKRGSRADRAVGRLTTCRRVGLGDGVHPKRKGKEPRMEKTSHRGRRQRSPEARHLFRCHDGLHLLICRLLLVFLPCRPPSFCSPSTRQTFPTRPRSRRPPSLLWVLEPRRHRILTCHLIHRLPRTRPGRQMIPAILS